MIANHPDILAGLAYENADPATLADRRQADAVRILTVAAALAPAATPAPVLAFRAAARR